MTRWLCWFLAFAVVAPLPKGAQADDMTLEYHLVVHATEAHSIGVPGKPGHEVGVASFRGIAIFDDGRIAQHAYAGSFEFVDGAGDFDGHAQWVFEDGSRLSSRYVGRAEPLPGGGIAFSGSHAEVTGEGAFAGVAGEGSFEGKRIDYLKDGGETYQRGRLEHVLPGG